MIRLPVFAVLTVLFAAPLVFVGCKRGEQQPPSRVTPADEFLQLANKAQTFYENRDAEGAIAQYQKAVELRPGAPEMRLNLANAYLLGGRSEDAIREAQETLKREPNSAAALYVLGSAHLRLGQWEAALKALQQANFIDPGVAATSFQIGVAQQGLGNLEDAAAVFQEALRLDPRHPGGHYALAQVWLRLKKRDAANEELEKHKAMLAKRGNVLVDAVTIERSKYTRIRPPATDEQPGPEGNPVTFADATKAFFATENPTARGPVAIIDLQHDGRNSILAMDGESGFRLFRNDLKTFHPQEQLLPVIPGARYYRTLVGDLDNDRFEDALVLSDKGTQFFRFTEGGAITDSSQTSGLGNVSAKGGALTDLEFTGKLNLVTITPQGEITAWRNQGNLTFGKLDIGIPESHRNATQILSDDWNGDDLPDLFVARETEAPLLLLNRHGGPLDAGASPSKWPAGSAINVGDLNNDTLNDLVVLTSGTIECVFGGLPESEHVRIPVGDEVGSAVSLIDYDNDGWLDIFLSGQRLRVWRNLGRAGFRETTAALGIATLALPPIQGIHGADFDGDGDTDLLLSFETRGLMLLRNDGGNANQQIKIRLTGNRSNASGIGTRLVLTAGPWHTSRTVRSLPVEIGVGKHTQLDSIAIHWSDIVYNVPDVKIENRGVITLDEVPLPTGSCPNLYTWDGTRFRFVTDFLGSAPLGLRLTDDRFIETDSDELVWIGDDSSVKPRDGAYVLQLTEELREVLYLDEAKLVVIDHSPGTEIFPTSKLLPGKPFPQPELMALTNRRPLLRATRSDGTDITESLAETDGKVVSPVKLRRPQLRGLAEPFSITLDFAPLETDHPLVLALTGWLRFGGGMANVAASHDPSLPFPFPVLEVETSEGTWQPVDVVVGAPSGKTKRILVDLGGKLPPGSRRLRLTSAFEIHWDRIALFDRAPDQPQMTVVTAATADLHWHGFGEYEDHPWNVPLTPSYDQVSHTAKWLSTVSGWATRYGDVRELIDRRDNALLLLASGDEVTLTFPVEHLPAMQAGSTRDFFLLSSGWDKDGDYHVERGLTIEPLPFHGMDAQPYGTQVRPEFENDDLMRKHNTRWIGPRVLTRRNESEDQRDDRLRSFDRKSHSN